MPPAGAVAAMVQAGLPKHVAEVFAELYAGLGVDNIRPNGDRMVQGKREIDEVIKALVQ